jgi:DNA-binding transcriptional ArsR family regulator
VSSAGPEQVEAAAVLHALAEPRRIELLRLLTDQQLCTRDLVSATGMAQPLVSHHLRVLRQSLLVDSTVCANLRVYRVRADTLRVLGERRSAMAERAAVTSSEQPC